MPYGFVKRRNVVTKKKTINSKGQNKFTGAGNRTRKSDLVEEEWIEDKRCRYSTPMVVAGMDSPSPISCVFTKSSKGKWGWPQATEFFMANQFAIGCGKPTCFLVSLSLSLPQPVAISSQ
ncbi:hypothetical protein TNCV_4951941 [Trichonephila clavipes]|nr:hypothetical protein TNCV_4951941 [Trichonephila clavipes]